VRESSNAVRPLHPPQSGAPESSWQSLVPVRLDNAAEHATPVGDAADLEVEEPRGSTSELVEEAAAVHDFAQPDPMEGAWVAAEGSLRIRHDLTFFAIQRQVLVTASHSSFNLARGPKPHSITLGDACLNLQSNEVMQLDITSGQPVRFQRIDHACCLALSTLQGSWKHRGESRRQQKMMTITGIVYQFSSHETFSQGRLTLQNGAVTLKDFVLRPMAHDKFVLQGPSGRVWSFIRQR